MSNPRTQIIGHVGADPKSRDVGGKTVVNLSVGVTVGWGDKKATQWWNVSVWGKSTDFVQRYIKKGSHVAVHGRISLREYEHNGQKRASLELDADDVQSLDKKGDRDDAGQRDTGGRSESSYGGSSGGGYSGGGAVGVDDDIPF